MSDVKNKGLTEKHKKAVGIVSIILFLAFCFAVSWLIGRPMIQFVSEPEKFRIWVDSHGFWGKIAFIGMVAFQVIIALIPGEPLEIGAGYAFGAVEGTLLCLIGIYLGTVIVFLLVRKFGVKLCEVFFSREKILSLKFLQNKRKSDLIILLLFFLPGTPKDLMTYILGITDIKFSFLLLLTAARIPSVITSTVGGSALGVKKYVLAIIVFGATVLVSVIGILIYKLILAHKNKEN